MKQHRWFLLSIVLLYVATLIGFTVTQVNFNEHKEIASQACRLSLVNRKVIRELVKLELTETDHPENLPKVKAVERKINNLIESTKCKEL